MPDRERGAPSLLALQRAFFDRVSGPLAGAPPDGAAGRRFLGSAAFSVDERLDLYADMFAWRQIEALGEDYPALGVLLGDELFAEVARAYLVAFPSRHHSLGRLGAHLPDFLRSAPVTALRPDLPDLAGLEWARAQAFIAADEAPLDGQALAAAGDRLAGARLQLAAHLEVIETAHDVLPLHQALRAGDEPPPPRPGRATVAVWRRQQAVLHAAIAPAEAEALRQALAGAPFASVCAAFTEGGVEAALAAVTEWLADGWLVDLWLEGERPA